MRQRVTLRERGLRRAIGEGALEGWLLRKSVRVKTLVRLGIRYRRGLILLKIRICVVWLLKGKIGFLMVVMMVK